VALDAVNEVEQLTTGLSRKIWQKLTVLYAMPPVPAVAARAADATAPGPAGTPLAPTAPVRPQGATGPV
jgi:hypothetical protein